MKKPKPKTGTRYQQLVRLLRLWKRIDGLHRLPKVDDLAADLGVSARTVRRYLAVLEEAHLAVPPRCNESDYAA